ncbi:MAG: hypothetical protein MPJ50_14265 [Pirellulales bacterium]|nr:hypothetical protein [Pirellulales bacterium]
MRIGTMWRLSVLLLLAAVVALVVGPSSAPAQHTALTNRTEQEHVEGFRRLAAGVEYTFPADIQEEEKVTREDLIQILNKDQEYGVRAWSDNRAKNVKLTCDVWALELTIKPCRMMWIDVPNPNGKFDRKLVWYLWYHVKNVSDQPVTFTPKFVLHLKDLDKSYKDQLVPVAMGPISEREDPKRKPKDSVSMSEQEIAPAGQSGDEVWGCALWEDVDPTTDEFSIFVHGLTNAYKMEAVDKPEGDGKKWEYVYKTLQINFSRPGDEFHEHSKEVRLGDGDGVEYRWIYQ